MPYKRLYNKAKKVVRRGLKYVKKRYVNKKGNLKLNRVVKDVRMVKRLMNTEVKEFNTIPQGTGQFFYFGASATPAITPGTAGSPPPIGYYYRRFSYPAQGVGQFQRIGNSIKLQSISAKCLVRRPANSGVYSGKIRVMLVVDKQAQLSEQDDPVNWMYEVDQNGLYSLSSEPDRYRQSRFRIIASKTINMSNLIFSTTFNLYKKLNDRIRFNDTTGADWIDKAFYIVVMTETKLDTPGTSDVLPEFCGQLQMRMTFTDT